MRNVSSRGKRSSRQGRTRRGLASGPPAKGRRGKPDDYIAKGKREACGTSRSKGRKPALSASRKGCFPGGRGGERGGRCSPSLVKHRDSIGKR